MMFAIARKFHIVVFAVLLALPVLANGPDGLKVRVAVIDFEDKAGYGHNIGRGVADMVVTSLVETKKFTVLERAEMDKIMKEIMRGESGIVTPSTAAKIGKQLGAAAVIIGSVTEFGISSNKGDVGIGRFKVGRKTDVARVGVDIRLVDTESGEILTAKSAVKEQSSKGISFDVIDRNLDFSNLRKWDRTLPGKAARKAIDECVGHIAASSPKLAWQGKLIKVSGSTVFLRPGSKGGVKPGMELYVYSKGEELIDPDTGESLGSEEEKIGKIKVISDISGGKACKAEIVSGEGFAAGNIVKAR